MPRKISIKVDELISVFTLFADQIRQIPIPADPVWALISKELLCHSIVMSPRYCYIVVKLNRYDMWFHLGITEPSFTSNTPPTQQHYNSSDSADSKESSITFSLTFEYEELSSLTTTVQYFEKKSPAQSCNRKYTILAPWAWTSKVHEKFFAATHIPCAVIYKNHRILDTGSIYLTINGQCRDCGSSFCGKIYRKPVLGEDITMECSYSGPYKTCSTASKRRLIGPHRQKLLRKLVKEGKSGPYIRGTFARKHLQYGEVEPSHIPSPNALRCAKYRAKLDSLIDEDPVRALCILKGEAPYAGIIHDIAIDKFNIHYWSAEEVRNYRLLCKKSKEPRVCIDATGSLVHKIKHLSQTKPSHIFLYEMVAHDPEKKLLFPVAHMLSEKHDNITISSWLSEWQRQTDVKGPKIVITDGSLALMYAVTRSFTQHSTLQSYLQTCFRLLHQENIPVPNCMIRLDVNHTMHLFSQWDAFKKSHHPRFKQFYMKVLALLVMSTNYNRALKILKDILMICLAESEGPLCLVAKRSLLNQISGESTGINDILESYDDKADSTRDDGEELKEESHGNNSFSEETQQLINSVQEEIASEEDEDNINPLFAPEISKKLLASSKYIPLWSGIMVPIFKFGRATESSAAVESTFKDLKHSAMKHIDLPIRVDEFVRKHIDSLIGSSILAKASSAKDDFRETIEESGSEIDDPLPKTEEPEIEEPKMNEIKIENSQPEKICESFNIEQAFSVQPCNTYDLPTPDNTYETATENWRNLIGDTRSKKKITHFDKNTALGLMNIGSKSLSPVIGILKNGLLCRLCSVKIDGVFYSLTNTCAFDSIVQAFCVAYVDSIIFQTYIESIREDNLLWDLIHSLVRDGVSAHAYRKRAQILINLKDINQHFIFTKKSAAIPGSFSIDTSCTVASLIQSLFTQHPSLTECRHCNKCTKNTSRSRVFFTYALRSFDLHNINLSDIISQLITDAHVECDDAACRSTDVTCTYDLGHFLLIELSTPGQPEEFNPQLINFDPNVTLAIIPNCITVRDTEYKLRACISFIPSASTEPHAVGHYIAYCLRPSGIWECYDDLGKSVMRYSDNIIRTKTVRMSLLIFTK